ncbi:MAG: tetratricopeptide repeat protein [Acidobacteria bacterium]|nr:tetratricopeptide repeat protein [Acidobacteriota bacterium]
MNTAKHRWGTVLLLLAIAASGGATMSAQAQGQRPSERVENILRLKKIVAEHPEDVAARVELGNALDDNGDSAGAVAQYREAIRINPKFAPAYRNLALAHIRQGQWAAAESAARDALRIEPQYAQARCDLAVALGSQRKTDEAAREWQQAMAANRKSVTRYGGFVRTRAEAEEFSRADAIMAARWLVGLTLRDAGDRSRAIRELENLLDKNKRFALAQVSLAELYAQSGRQRESEAAMQTAIGINPALAEAAPVPANAPSDAAAKARLQTTNVQLAELKRIVPNLIQMQRLHGPGPEQVAKARELLKESAIRMRPLLENFPEDAEGFLLLGDALRELEEPRAVWAYETAIRAAQGRQAYAARAWMGLALLQIRAGRDAAAAEMFAQALLAAPEDSEVLNAAAWLAATSADESARSPQRAVEWAKKAVEITKEKHAVYLSTLAEAYFASGQIVAAVRTIGIAIALEPDETAYREQLEKFRKAGTGR